MRVPRGEILQVQDRDRFSLSKARRESWRRNGSHSARRAGSLLACLDGFTFRRVLDRPAYLCSISCHNNNLEYDSANQNEKKCQWACVLCLSTAMCFSSLYQHRCNFARRFMNYYAKSYSIPLDNTCYSTVVFKSDAHKLNFEDVLKISQNKANKIHTYLPA